MHTILKADRDRVAWYFSLISFSAPITGVVIGGIMVTKFGGYNTKKSQLLIAFIGILSCLSCLPIPFVDDFYIFCVLIWLMLFFGGFILPQVTGIMLNSVNEYHRTQANSLASLSYNCIGCLPAPSFYGMVSEMTGGESSRWPLACLLYSTILTVGLLINGIRMKINKDKFAAKNAFALGNTGTTL